MKSARFRKRCAGLPDAPRDDGCSAACSVGPVRPSLLTRLVLAHPEQDRLPCSLSQQSTDGADYPPLCRAALERQLLRNGYQDTYLRKLEGFWGAMASRQPVRNTAEEARRDQALLCDLACLVGHRCYARGQRGIDA
jgi:hypothetical protein